MTEIIHIDHEEVHDLPATWSDERQHWLDAECWCRPSVITNRDANGRIVDRQVKHRDVQYADILAEARA